MRTTPRVAGEPPLTELLAIELILQKVEPALRLAPVRHLRKILHYLRAHGRAVPLNGSLPFWATKSELAAADILPQAMLAGSHDPLLLITTPDDRALYLLPEEDLLREYWRLLFQAAILSAIDRKPGLTAAACQEKLARFGPAVEREIRYVLEAEHGIDPEAGAIAVYRAFAAAYLDLQAFAPDSFAVSTGPAL